MIDNNFNYALLALLEDDGLSEAIYLSKLTTEQKERYNKIKEIYLEECLKDCKF